MKIAELAKEVSSKNAGNFHVTFDIVFENREDYERVKNAGVITTERIAALYSVNSDTVLRIINFDPGNAIKIVMRRPHPSGDPGETDVFGAQQYPPLLDLVV